MNRVRVTGRRSADGGPHAGGGADPGFDDRALDAAERLEMALAARSRRVAPIDVAAAFGADAAALAQVGAALEGVAAPPAASASFAARLEADLGRAYDDRIGHLPGGRRRTARAAGMRAGLPGAAELAAAAAITLLLGATSISDALGLPPALAATPTITAHDTRTPLGPTGTAAHGTPAAMETAEPVAMARIVDAPRGIGRPATR